MSCIPEGTWASVLYLYLKQNVGVNNMCIPLTGMRSSFSYMSGFANNALLGGGVRVRAGIRDKERTKGTILPLMAILDILQWMSPVDVPIGHCIWCCLFSCPPLGFYTRMPCEEPDCMTTVALD